MDIDQANPTIKHTENRVLTNDTISGGLFGMQEVRETVCQLIVVDMLGKYTN